MSDPRTQPAGTRGWDGKERRIPRAKRRTGAAVSVNAWLALFFVGGSLVALAVVPVVTGQRTESVRDEILSVLEPAREITAELESVLASEMVALQGFLFTGAPRFRQAYLAAQRREVAIHDRLAQLAEEMDLSIQEQRVVLWTLSFEWHEHHGAALDGRVPRAAFVPRLSEDHRRYERALTEARALRDAVTAEVRAGQVRMERAVTRQTQLTVALVALALVSTLIVGVLARLLRRLAVQAEERRAEAVRVRREIDAVLEATGDGVIGVDLEGRCTFVNVAAAKLLGVSVRDAQRHTVHDLVHGDPEACPGRERCRLLEAIETRKPARLLDQTFQRHGGAPFPVQCEIRPMLDGRRVRGLVLTFVDLSEIREAEEALKQAVRARDEVVAVVSHDLRGPVGTINAAAQLLLEVPLSEDQWREHVAAIERSSSRLTALISDLLDVARIEAGALAVTPVPRTVASILDEALEMARPLARTRGVTLERSDPDDPHRSVRVDRDRILQVFANLIDNAVRYSPDGGTVTLAARSEGGQVRFGVRDQGPGIPREAQDSIFDRFRQLQSAVKAGAGLGLAIVRGIVEAHGGRVWVESELGAGASFYFTLPAVEADGRAVPEPRAGAEVS